MEDNKTNFVSVVPNSQFYTDLQQIKTTLDCMAAGLPKYTPNYMITAINNTMKLGYKLTPPAPMLAKHDYVLFTKGRMKRPLVGQIRVITKDGLYLVKRLDNGEKMKFTDPSLLKKWVP